MSVQNFSFLAGLEVPEKFVVVVVGWWVTLRELIFTKVNLVVSIYLMIEID